MTGKKDGYTITVAGPGHNFERAIDEATANIILNLIMTGSVAAVSGTRPLSAAIVGTKAGVLPVTTNISGQTAKQFIAQKKPKTQYERIACIGYYLTHVRNTPQFVTDDITAMNTEAAQPPILNAPQIVTDTTAKYRYLSGAGDRNKQITVLGEAIVEALPDREAVKAAISEHGAGRRRKRPIKKKK